MTPRKGEMEVEYLFRGKTSPTDWVYGDLIHEEVGINYIRENINTATHDSFCNYYVYPATIGQYIGIIDRNGQKIFDGDIIRAIAEGEEDIYTVEWCGDRKYPAFDLKPQIDCDGNGLSYLLWVEAEIEVIGNIHDNPELLEAKRDD